MKYKKSLFLLAFFVMLMAYVPKAMSATPACTEISNTASITYKVGGVDQTYTPTGNETVKFNVGAKINVTVTNNDGANVTVTPGGKAALKFTVTNDGNVTNDVALSYVAAANGTKSPYKESGSDVYDSFDGTNIAIYEDTNGNGNYDDGIDTASTSIDDLAPGSSKVYFIVYNANDLTQASGSIAVYYLVAQAKWANDTVITEGNSSVTQTMSGNVACGGGTTIDIVFADANGPAPDTNDGDRDGKNSDVGAYVVQNANISVSKTSAVYWDPVNLTSSPKPIPGAVVTYTITIDNTLGNANATVTLSDSLATQISNGYIAFNTQFNDGVNSCSSGYGIVVDGVCKTNDSDADNADWNATTANTVTVTNLVVNQGTSKVVKFQVIIQ